MRELATAITRATQARTQWRIMAAEGSVFHSNDRLGKCMSDNDGP